jgi:hypothetical protein
LESFSIEKVNSNQHTLFVTPKSSIKTILLSKSSARAPCNQVIHKAKLITHGENVYLTRTNLLFGMETWQSHGSRSAL